MPVSWNDRPIPSLARAAAPHSVTSCPLKTMRPSLRRDCPLSRLKSVVVPAPFGPMMDMRVASITSSVTRSTATCPPNRMVASRADRIGDALVTGAARSWS
jgi:hypothetical protein